MNIEIIGLLYQQQPNEKISKNEINPKDNTEVAWDKIKNKYNESTRRSMWKGKSTKKNLQNAIIHGGP